MGQLLEAAFVEIAQGFEPLKRAEASGVSPGSTAHLVIPGNEPLSLQVLLLAAFSEPPLPLGTQGEGLPPRQAWPLPSAHELLLGSH